MAIESGISGGGNVNWNSCGIAVVNAYLLILI